ncbi:MAG: hypothetical protein H6Q21_1208 [Bacteroidetes bacterium]|jgi:hypothetical protein|nr:hypothetical protein [Bacteroidota bacterium]
MMDANSLKVLISEGHVNRTIVLEATCHRIAYLPLPFFEKLLPLAVI